MVCKCHIKWEGKFHTNKNIDEIKSPVYKYKYIFITKPEQLIVQIL